MANAHAIGAPDRAHPALTLLATSLGTFVAILDTSVVNLALHSIQKDLRCSMGTLQWIMDAYTLVYAGFILTGGALSDRYGRRLVFMAGMGVFGAGTLVCALAPAAPVLLAGRALSGFGAALELPAALAILNVSFEGRSRSSAIAIWASANGLAMGIGPTVGGLLLAAFGWRSLFYVVLPFVLATVALSAAIPESRAEKGRSLDAPGQVLGILALVALCLGLVQAPAWGWTSLATSSAVGTGLVAVALFVLWEVRARAPMLAPALFRNRVFSSGLVVALLMTVGFYVLLFVFPLYLQVTRGHSALRTGLELLPQSVTFFLVSSLMTGKLVGRLGPRVMVSLGFAFSAVATLGIALLAGRAPDYWLALCLFSSGLGFACMTGPVSNIPVANAPRNESGMSSGAVNVARMVGATFGVAIVGSFVGSVGRAPSAHEVERGMRGVLVLGAAVHALGALVAVTLLRRDSLEA
jgi:EmrB/QacA subfamily drug resistance transporter